jgi:hypothetical protein
MSELKKVILREIEELTSSGLDKNNAIDIVVKRHHSNYYQEAIKLKSELGLEHEEELKQFKLHNDGTASNK